MTERRKGGRRKGTAVKYASDDSLIDQWNKALNGKYVGSEYEWGIVRNLVNGLWNDPSYRRFMRYFLHPKKALLKIVSDAVDRKDWKVLGKLAEMFAFAEETKGKEAVDALRALLLGANLSLHAICHVHKLPQPKKKNLLALFRQANPEYSEKEDSDIFKLMRELGLPRPPDHDQIWQAAVAQVASIPLDNKKTSIQY